ncbi:MAG: glycosyltransferase [Pirellulales bacterium]
MLARQPHARPRPVVTSDEEARAPRLAPVPADLTVAVMTPWNQQCGNAEFMKRLAIGLERCATILPFDMRNLGGLSRWTGSRALDRSFRDLVASVNASGADVVHIQHEFCFFGRNIAESSRRFHWVMQQLRAPVVVSLHTWLSSMSLPRRTRLMSRGFAGLVHHLRNRHITAALTLADAIVLHSQETHRKFVESYPELQARTQVLSFPIERPRVEPVASPLAKPADDVWLMLPGFVSRYKGHLRVLEALRYLPNNVKLVAAGGIHPKDRGGSDYWLEVLQRADALGLQGRVLVTGYLDDVATQAAVLAQADVFVLPYDEVGQSGSAVLADVLAYDRPVITSRARSMFVYRMDPQTAFSSRAVDVTDAEAFAAAVGESIRGDAEGSAEARGHRVAVLERHSMAATQAGYERVYRSVLASRAGGAK